MTKLAVTAALLGTVGVACTASAQAPPQAQTIVRAGAQPSTQGPGAVLHRQGSCGSGVRGQRRGTLQRGLRRGWTRV